MMGRRQGFTLIELLVVIAIIGILAAMLFPVFARARESARKVQCLANVKNIAMAVQIYLADYDRFPANNRDWAEQAWLAGQASSPYACSRPGGECVFNGANPYLRWAVVLDEYVKSRDVWLCPSAQHVGNAAWIVPQYTPVFWQYLQNRGFGPCGGPCCDAWPSGWGGAVTDSVVQGLASAETGAFQFSVSGTALQSYGRSTAEIGDPAHYVVCGDNQQGSESMRQMAYAAYGCGCGLSEADRTRFLTEPGFRKRYAPHLGGINLGFADGHARWWDAETAIGNAGSCCAFQSAPGQVEPCAPHRGLSGLCTDFVVTDNMRG